MERGQLGVVIALPSMQRNLLSTGLKSQWQTGSVFQQFFVSMFFDCAANPAVLQAFTNLLLPPLLRNLNSDISFGIRLQ